MKTTNTIFNLAQSASRVALLVGITAGTVCSREIEAAVLADVEPRRHKKPVVAEGVRYESVTAAAKALVTARSSTALRMRKEVFFSLVQSEQKRISRLCTKDVTVGYYWSE